VAKKKKLDPEPEVKAADPVEPTPAEGPIPGLGLPTVIKVRPFPMGAINARISEAISQIPAGATVAVLGYVDEDGGHFAAAAKLGEHWSFMGHLDKPWNKPLEYAAGVLWHN
jgi:hypothetical protein